MPIFSVKNTFALNFHIRGLLSDFTRTVMFVCVRACVRACVRMGGWVGGWVCFSHRLHTCNIASGLSSHTRIDDLHHFSGSYVCEYYQLPGDLV